MSRGRSAAVLLLLAGLTALVAVPTWLTTTGASALRGDVAVPVPGTQAAPAVLAGAVVLLAAVAAVGLVGRAGRWVVVAVVAGAGVLVVAAALAVLADPAGTAQPVVAEQTGVGRLTGPVHVLVWPYLAVLAGALDVLGAVGLARASGTWAGPSRRHEVARSATAGVGSPTSRGTRRGPSTGTGDRAGPTGGAPVPGADGAADRAAEREPDDERATWDALSRGDDPS